MSKNSSSGFAAITIMLVLVLIILVAGSLYYFSNQKIDTNPPASAQKPVSHPNSSSEVPAGLPSSTPIPIFSASDDPKLNFLKSQILDEVDRRIATLSAQDGGTAPKEAFVYFGNSGSTQSTTWSDMSGSDIKFNINNYPRAKAFYFQADLQTDAPDRTGYARIYDITHSLGVAGSDIAFSGLTANLKESASLNLAPGNLQLRIQLHSDLNVTTIYNPRIKIVY